MGSTLESPITEVAGYGNPHVIFIMSMDNGMTLHHVKGHQRSSSPGSVLGLRDAEFQLCCRDYIAKSNHVVSHGIEIVPLKGSILQQ